MSCLVGAHSTPLGALQTNFLKCKLFPNKVKMYLFPKRRKGILEKMSKNEARLGRVNEELMKALSQIITYELKNPDVTGMISVTRVKVTPDLKYAKVYVSMLNSKSVEKTMQGLKDSAGFMRSQVARMVNLRITPELVFEYDDSIEHGERIDNILKQISEQDKAIKEKK